MKRETRARLAPLRFPASLLIGAVVFILVLPKIQAATKVPDGVLGTALAALLVAGGAELAHVLPWPSSPRQRVRAGVGAAMLGATGVLCCALAASDIADRWPAGARTAAVVAAVVGLPLLAGGSAMVRQAEHALHDGVITDPRGRGERS